MRTDVNAVLAGMAKNVVKVDPVLQPTGRMITTKEYLFNRVIALGEDLIHHSKYVHMVLSDIAELIFRRLYQTGQCLFQSLNLVRKLARESLERQFHIFVIVTREQTVIVFNEIIDFPIFNFTKVRNVLNFEWLAYNVLTLKGDMEQHRIGSLSDD